MLPFSFISYEILSLHSDSWSLYNKICAGISRKQSKEVRLKWGQSVCKVSQCVFLVLRSPIKLTRFCPSQRWLVTCNVGGIIVWFLAKVGWVLFSYLLMSDSNMRVTWLGVFLLLPREKDFDWLESMFCISSLSTVILCFSCLCIWEKRGSRLYRVLVFS